MDETYYGYFLGGYNLCIPNMMFCNPYQYQQVMPQYGYSPLYGYVSCCPVDLSIQSKYSAIQTALQSTMSTQALIDSMNMNVKPKKLIDNIYDLEQIIYGEVNPILEWRKEQERRIEEKYRWIEQIVLI